MLIAYHYSFKCLKPNAIKLKKKRGSGIPLFFVNGFILFGGLVLAFVTYLRIWLRRKINVYLVSPKRIEVIHGLVAKSSKEVRIQDIRNINVKRRGIRGWLGVGDVEIATAGSGSVEVVFRGVFKPHEVKELVRSLQDQV